MLSRQLFSVSLKARTETSAIRTTTTSWISGGFGFANALAYTKGTHVRWVSHVISQSPTATYTVSHVPRIALGRFFASGSSRKPAVLANEDLLVTLRRQFPKANGPTEIDVRLVIDERGDNPSTVMVCTLAEAIEVSLDRMTDLIGVALNKDPPVIRAARLSKLEYQNEQAVAKQKLATKSKQSKTFRFRAGIDANDLNRKIQTMTKFLEQGVECEYTVFSKARTLRENSIAGMELVERIQVMVADFAVQKRAPQTNEHGNHIRVCLVPKKN
jgi:translation initiation factor IF-3